MKFVVALLIVCAVAVSGRQDPPPAAGTVNPTPAPATPAPAAPPAAAPAAGAAPAADLCSSGKQQSPIDVITDKTECVRHGEAGAQKFRIDLHYQPTVNLSVSNSGNAINVAGNLGFATVGGCNPCNGQEFDVTNVALRQPAEHTINGRRYLAELQITHQKKGGSEQIISSVFFYQQPDGGFHNGFLEQLDFFNLPAATQSKALLGSVDLNKLYEAFRGEFYSYAGSTTSSPCSENVTWVLYKTPLGLTKLQVDAAKAAIKGDFRAVQSVGDRKVTWYRLPQ